MRHLISKKNKGYIMVVQLFSIDYVNPSSFNISINIWTEDKYFVIDNHKLICLMSYHQTVHYKNFDFTSILIIE